MAKKNNEPAGFSALTDDELQQVIGGVTAYPVEARTESVVTAPELSGAAVPDPFGTARPVEAER